MPENTSSTLTVRVRVIDTPEEYQALAITAERVVGSTLVDSKPEDFHLDGICWHGNAQNPADPDGPWVPVKTKFYLRHTAVPEAQELIAGFTGVNGELYRLLKDLEQKAFDDDADAAGWAKGEITLEAEEAERTAMALEALFDEHTPKSTAVDENSDKDATV